MRRFTQLIFRRRRHPSTTTAPPTSFAMSLDEDAFATVARIRDQILGARRPGENLETYRQRSYQAWRQATELVREDVTLPTTTEPTTSSPDSELDDYRAQLTLMSETLSSLDQTWMDTPPDLAS